MNPTPNHKLNIVLLVVAFAATMAIIIFGSYIQEGFDIGIGDVSPQSFSATHQVENRILTEIRRDEARASAGIVIARDIETEARIRYDIENVFLNITAMREQNLANLLLYESMISAIPEPDTYNDNDSEGEFLYAEETPVVAEEEEEDEDDEVLSEPLPLPALPIIDQSFVDASRGLSQLSLYHIELLVRSDESILNHFQVSVFEILDGLLEEGIDTPHGLRDDIYENFSIRGIPFPLNDIGYLLLNEYIVPNIVINEEATNELIEEAAAAVSPAIFLQNQHIVHEGEIITEQIYQVLVDLGIISAGYTINSIPIIGSAVILLTVFAIAGTYIYLFVPKLYQNKRHVFLLFTLYTIMAVVTLFFSAIHYIFVPILMFTMLVGMLLSYKLALVLNSCMTIIAFLIVNADLSFMLYFLITGTIVAIITRYALERSKVIVLSLLISVISAIVAFAINLMLDRTFSSYSLFVLAYGGGSAFLSVIISMGTLPIWESFFGVITPIKLLDLTNPSNEILRRLSVEAPGTYHHSIIVSNLAEAAAYDIGADVVVARVGAFFHDIGKLRHPSFFVENQVGKNLHDDLYHLASAEIIKDHVAHGLELATDKRLPLILQDIIAQHHGTTFIKYFYDKALTESAETGEHVNPESYRYDGPIPQFKESAIVMLADTCEAAIRAMVSKLQTKEEVEKFVHKLIENKLMEGQLIDSGLTIRDLDLIEKAFLRVFNGMYHQRVSYPKDTLSKERALKNETNPVK